jgi:uncharacterized protein
MDLNGFRAMKDKFLKEDPHSPLSGEQKQEFRGLEYFPENPDLRLTTNVKEIPGQPEIQMQTSTGDIRSYRKYGTFSFEVEGQQAELTMYATENNFFLPFVDSLAGEETYPAGRYLDVEQLPDGRFAIDFNLSYNPYCAYNEQWSCPLTPFENRLKVPIRAGEKIYRGMINRVFPT